MKFIHVIVVTLACLRAVEADVRLPAVVSDHMVVQADAPVAIWGWADAKEAITVEFAGQKKSTTADNNGKWQVTLDALEKNDRGQSMTIRGHNTLVIHDAVVGEVWLASGQSNMEMQIKGKQHGTVDNADAEIAAAKHPQIRMFMHTETFEIYQFDVPPDEPYQDREGHWHVCSPETVAEFSAIGYFFACDLMNELKSPVGILSASVGGTPIEAWTSKSAQHDVTVLKPLLDDWTKRLDGFVPAVEQQAYVDAKAVWLKKKAEAVKVNQPIPKAPAAFKNLLVMKPGGLFNGVLAPLVPYTIRGVIWYQGERNAAGPFTGLYGVQLETLIRDLRQHWNIELHVAWVQLPAFLKQQSLPSEPNGWGVAVRDEMRRTLKVPRTSMAITIDLGGEKNGHPTNKVDYARRLSNVVLHDVYQKETAIWTGPLFRSAQTEGQKMILTFDHAEGLKPRSVKLEGFGIAGADRKFVWANAEIRDEKVYVWNDQVAMPQAVRYSWSSHPIGNLVNNANYPASPFRTDDW